jgi:putrescine aminotransferase
VTRLWHSEADMAAVRDNEFVVDSGWDVWLWDADGGRCLDAAAGLCGANIGHGRHEMAQAIAAQLWRVESGSVLGDIATGPAVELAERLAERAPMPEARVLLTSCGETGTAAAAALARRYWAESGEPGRTHILARTAAAPSSVDAAAHAIAALGNERVAAFVVDPILAADGVHPPAHGYIEDLTQLLRDTGVLLIADAVVGGFGPLGTSFGIERWAVEPDMVVVGESVTSGYLPLGGVLVGERVAEPFWSTPGGPVFRHGPASGGHVASCAAALKNLEILDDEGLLGRAEELEDELRDALEPLRAHPLVAEVRGGAGTLAAVELDPILLAVRPGAPADVHRLARDRGVLVRPLATSIGVAPPLTAKTCHLSRVADALADSADELWGLARSGRRE